MIEIIIPAADARQRVDKYIVRLLPGAGKSLIYKQIRKKNITLNSKKMTGSEILSDGDKLQFFFSDETFNKFKNTEAVADDAEYLITVAKKAYDTIKNVEVIYEDDNIICINKPVNTLSQRADDNELSLNEWLLGYLISTGNISSESIKTFKPSVLNRLDRNTTGMVIGSKTFLGANVISELLRDRTVNKYYLTVVKGRFLNDGIYQAYHYKDDASNKVTIADSVDKLPDSPKVSSIKTGIRLVKKLSDNMYGDLSVLEIDLITGKSHQIRAHLAHLGYPVLGDIKYGDKKLNERLRKNGISTQMLHSYKMQMPSEMPEAMSMLKDKTIVCNPPQFWRRINVDLEI